MVGGEDCARSAVYAEASRIKKLRRRRRRRADGRQEEEEEAEAEELR